MIAAISRKKKHTQDSRTITKTITFGIKNGPCETLPFFSFSFSSSFPFPLLFLFFPFPSLTIPFPFAFPRSCEFFDQGVKPALGKTIPFPFPWHQRSILAANATNWGTKDKSRLPSLKIWEPSRTFTKLATKRFCLANPLYKGQIRLTLTMTATTSFASLDLINQGASQS